MPTIKIVPTQAEAIANLRTGLADPANARLAARLSQPRDDTKSYAEQIRIESYGEWLAREDVGSHAKAMTVDVSDRNRDGIVIVRNPGSRWPVILYLQRHPQMGWHFASESVGKVTGSLPGDILAHANGEV